MNKRIIVIGAVSQDGVYGIGNRIPWQIKEDMQHFKKQTTGQTVVMGRGTWESLPLKFRPLPGRVNMVITNTPDYKAEGAAIMKSIQQAIEAARTEKVFLIGGHDIWYYGMSAVAHEALITRVRKNFSTGATGERMAPELLDPPPSWGMDLMSSTHYGDEIPFTIQHWVRRGI